MKKTLFRTSVIVVLLLALIGLTVSSFAYWDRLTKTTEDREVELSEGAVISFEETLSPTEKLIPEGAVLGEGETYEVEFKYFVKLNKKAVTDLNLETSISDVMIGGNATLSELVNFTILPTTTTVNQEGVEVLIKVTLTEPSEEQYTEVANQIITFKVTFTATQA